MSLREYGFLILKWTGRDFRARYKRSQLQLFWAALQPILFVLIYVVIFGVIFQQSGGDVPYLSYLLSGVVIYRLVSSALNASSSIVDNHSIISHAKFPLEIVPISRVFGNGADMIVTVGGLLIVSVAQGVELSASLLWLPVVLAAAVTFTLALGVLLATVQVFVRDLEFVMTFVNMALFFASPISYLPEQLPAWLSWLNWVNPISVFIEALRDVTFAGTTPSLAFWVHLAMSGGFLLVSIAYLHSIGHRMVDLG